MSVYSIHILYTVVYIITVCFVAVGVWFGFRAWRNHITRYLEEASHRLQKNTQKPADEPHSPTEDDCRALVDDVPAIICKITVEGTIVFVNDFSKETLGYKPSDLKGLNWWKTFFPDSLSRQAPSFINSFREKEVLKDFTMTLANRYGALHAISWNARALRDPLSYAILEIVLIGIEVHSNPCSKFPEFAASVG